MFLRPSGGASPHLSHAPSPRVLQLLPEGLSARSTRQTVALAERLRASGGEMVVAGGDLEVEARLRRAGIDHRPFTATGALFATRCTQALLDTVHQRGVSLIHVHGTELGLTAKSFAEAVNLPLVMTVEDLPKSTGFLGRRSARKHMAGRPIVTHSSYAAEVLRRDFAVPAEALKVVQPVVDTNAFDAMDVSAERTIQLAHDWGLSDDARPIVLVPDAQPEAAWLQLKIQAAMTADAPEAVWVLMGPAEAADEVNKRFAEQGAWPRMKWVSNTSDLQAAYKLASVVLCLPESIPGATPPLMQAALEAQAMGRAVITSDFAAGPETIEPGKTGWITRHRDAGSLTYAVSAALDRDDVVQGAMALAARKFVEERFTAAAHHAAMLEVYGAAISER